MDFSDWTVSDVSDWLAHQNMDTYIPKFAANHIDGKALLALTPDQLQSIGVDGIHRTLLMQGIRALIGQHSTHAVDMWTTADVCKWLEHNDLRDLVPIFQQGGITGKQLLTLHSAHLVELGVASKQQRQLFRRARDRLFHLPYTRLEVNLWETDDVCNWLEHICLHDYLPAFQARKIDGLALLELTDSSLRDMGLSVRAHRMILLRQIERLQQESQQGAPRSCPWRRANGTWRRRGRPHYRPARRAR